MANHLSFADLDSVEGKKCKNFLEQMKDFRVYVGLIYFCFSFWASATKAFGVIPFNVIQLD